MYRAVLRETGEVVAVKVQRPGVQSLVSKDLYVLRRAAEVGLGLGLGLATPNPNPSPSPSPSPSPNPNPRRRHVEGD